ncbi:ribosomal protein S18-alanine N-acetyltransferase [Ruminococcus sp. OA3]|uniref:ribosomal protein S18-alanine N-acetyltransferase n=1 Tax=Ruminococcus sp. OA3 TaxID=2914164 RepID=UPI001F0645FF|nr:ribosomal protein S18-alanine N-acetyltransferase [Ruminococcus sp. OA3]MCH1981967.1 ribosomal protein S18-alanine N-acetyltransferase [Ruminococcus sp. OA3]
MITIRDMQIDDLEQVMPIESENFSVPWSETGFFSFLIREDAIFLVAEEEREILGYCGVLMVPDEGDITNVAVKKDRQHQGIGKLLVQELIKKSSDAGVTTLHLEVRESNTPAIGLYQKLGFVQVGVRRNYYEAPAEDGIMMVRR